MITINQLPYGTFFLLAIRKHANRHYKMLAELPNGECTCQEFIDGKLQTDYTVNFAPQTQAAPMPRIGDAS